MADVDITIRTIDKTNSKQLIGNFTELNSAIALMRQGFEAAKKAYDFSRQGAQLDFTRDKFDRLTESIGTTSDALLTDLRDATRGIYSDFELMESATNFVALGLAQDHDEAVRLARVAGGLNMNMNQLVLTLTNMTTMRFDALGVRVEGFKEKLADLESQGYDTNDAFKEAFLQQAENQLETVGDAADSTLGTFMDFEATLKDIAADMKVASAEGFAPFIRNLDDALEKSRELGQEGVVFGGRGWQVVKEGADSATLSYQGWARALEDSTPVLEEVAELQEKHAKYFSDLLNLTTNIAKENENHADKLADISEKMADNRAEAEKLYPWQAEELTSLNEKYADLQAAYDNEAAAHQARTDKILYDLLLQKLSVDGITEAEYEMALQAGIMYGVFDEESAQAARNFNIVTQAVIDGRLEVEGMKDALNSLPSRIPIDIAVNMSGAGVEYLGNNLYSQGGKKRSGGRGFASGGSFVIPEAYGYEGFSMGGMATASGGETVTVTPRGQGGGSMARIDPADLDNLARKIVEGVMGNGR